MPSGTPTSSEQTIEDRALRYEADHKTINAAVSGDKRAREHLIESIQDTIFRFCFAQIRDEQNAVDATQETALRMLSQLHKFDGNSKFSTWTLGIANNVCREYFRTRSRWSAAQEIDHIGGFQSDEQVNRLVRKESSAELVAAMDLLSDRQRQVVTLKYFEFLTIEEIAKILNIASGTVKATLNTALKRLKEKIVLENSNERSGK